VPTPKRRARTVGFDACALLTAWPVSSPCIADEPAFPAQAQNGFASELFSDWLERAERARITELGWVSPVTVTPRLEQNLLRFDQSL
jgi:hypothetical protein